MQGVAPDTYKIFKVISNYEELSPYFLIGGTALAIKINHRLSEDLDFFMYNKFPGQQFPLKNIDVIIKKLQNDFEKVEVLHNSKNETKLLVDDIKIDFFSDRNFHGPKEFTKVGFVKLPSLEVLTGMKLTALSLRDTWRDVYDLYCITLQQEVSGVDYFYNGFNKVMSSNYVGNKKKKENMFKNLLLKLSNIQTMTRIHNSEGKLIELKFIDQATPENISKLFEQYSNNHNNKGFSL